jgi:hypothetical protein
MMVDMHAARRELRERGVARAAVPHVDVDCDRPDPVERERVGIDLAVVLRVASDPRALLHPRLAAIGRPVESSLISL